MRMVKQIVRATSVIVLIFLHFYRHDKLRCLLQSKYQKTEKNGLERQHGLIMGILKRKQGQRFHLTLRFAFCSVSVLILNYRILVFISEQFTVRFYNEQT